jgi:hypothetical protein
MTISFTLVQGAYIVAGLLFGLYVWSQLGANSAIDY